MRPVPVPDELPLVAWPPPEPFEYAADVVVDGWPPPEPFESWGESGDDGWPPSEPLEEWAIVAEEAWAAGELADEDWPPRETDDSIGEQAGEPVDDDVIEMGPEWQEVPKEPPTPKPPPRRQDGPMAVFQAHVDRLPEPQLRAWRATGLDVMPSRWKGQPPDWWLDARPGNQQELADQPLHDGLEQDPASETGQDAEP